MNTTPATMPAESRIFHFSRGTQKVSIGDVYNWTGVYPGIYKVISFSNTACIYSPSGLGGTCGVMVENEKGEIDEWCGDSVASGIFTGFIKNEIK